MELKDTVVGVVGGGVVGAATARAFAEHVREVMVYDLDPARRTTDDLARLVASADLVFVCLPTPSGPGGTGPWGACDTSALDGFFEARTAQGEAAVNYVIKSTVPVGYTRRTAARFGLPNLVHSPEFLTARTATLDAHLPPRNVVGRPTGGGDADDWATNGCARLLGDLYRLRWPHVPVFDMTSDESEAVKLITNSFYAVKVAFWNEVYELCAKLGVGYSTVLDGILAGGRVHPSHTQVPGPDGRFGFGGACLPKDLASLIHTAYLKVVATPVMAAAQQRNGWDRERETE